MDIPGAEILWGESRGSRGQRFSRVRRRAASIVCVFPLIGRDTILEDVGRLGRGGPWSRGGRLHPCPLPHAILSLLLLRQGRRVGLLLVTAEGSNECSPGVLRGLEVKPELPGLWGTK